MTMDIASLVGAVSREIETREHEGKPARVLAARRIYETSADDLWDAITNPERVPRWFGAVSGDFRCGGRYKIEGNASGVITKCDPPRVLHLTWEYEGTSWVEVCLDPQGQNTTELKLEHIAHIPDGFWNEYGPGAGGVGWELALMGLAQYFGKESTPVTVDHEQEWLATQEGKQFTAQCSEAWGLASIAYGTEPDAARAAALRTTKFYCG